MFSYTAYGLDIESEICLSALPQGSSHRHVRIRRGKAEFPDAAGGRAVWITESEAYFRFAEIGSICVSHGTEIVVEFSADVPDATIELFILGPALAILLHQRGFLVLHASGVAINGGVAAFLGRSGRGKSTMAAALVKRGHTLFADDIVSISFVSDRPISFPGFPRLKLGVDAAERLGYPWKGLPPLLPNDGRREIFVEGLPPEIPKPLEHIYVLADGEVPAIERLSPQDGAMELIRHSYTASYLKRSGSAGANLRSCGFLVNAIPVRRVRRPLDLGRIREVANLVEKDFAANY
jgi:hypothetical protein